MFSFKIIQNWTKDLFHTTVLSIEKQNYMFNCGDGTQRNAADQNIKFNKVNTIFYNSSSIDAYLGTYGFSMTRKDQIGGQVIAPKDLKVEKNLDLLDNKPNKGKNKESKESNDIKVNNDNDEKVTILINKEIKIDTKQSKQNNKQISTMSSKKTRVDPREIHSYLEGLRLLF